MNQITSSDIQNHIEKMVKGDNPVITSEVNSKLKGFLNNYGFTPEEQDRWLKSFYTDWMVTSMKEINKVLEHEEKERIEDLCQKDGADAAGKYIIELSQAKPEFTAKYQKILGDQFKMTLDHFIRVTTNG